MFTGCELEEQFENEPDYSDDESPSESATPWWLTNSPNSNMNMTDTPGVGDNTFLWKPNSERNGNLVVLMPASLSAPPVGSVTVNGETGSYSGNHNGNRAHFRFSKPGSAYGSNVRVVLNKAGQTYQWTVPNGGSRYSQRY